MTLHAIKRRDPRNETEESIQRAAIQLLMLCAHPKTVFYHVPNGEARSKVTGARLKAMGVLPGVGDISLVLPDGRAAFVEIKTSIGRQSPEQKEFQRRVVNAGGLYAVCRSCDDVRSTLGSWGALRGVERPS